MTGNCERLCLVKPSTAEHFSAQRCDWVLRGLTGWNRVWMAQKEVAIGVEADAGAQSGSARKLLLADHCLTAACCVINSVIRLTNVRDLVRFTTGRH